MNRIFGICAAFLAVAMMGFMLAGCESVMEAGRVANAKGAGPMAEGMIAECARQPGQRAHLAAAINAKLIEKGSKARALALDCDGDGLPDELKGADE